jgi:hypothetical protein
MPGIKPDCFTSVGTIKANSAGASLKGDFLHRHARAFGGAQFKRGASRQIAAQAHVNIRNQAIVELLLALLVAVEFGVGIVGRCGMRIGKKRKNSSVFDYICY